MCLAGFCVHVIRYASVCFTTLAVAESEPIQGTEIALCLWATKAPGLRRVLPVGHKEPGSRVKI